MANFNLAYNIVARWEGGYQDHANDTGNYNSLGHLVGTNWGINAKVYEAWIGYPPSKSRMQQMTKEDAQKIYKAKFWDTIKGDSIQNQALANIIFDGRVNHGYTGVKLLQKVLGIVQDGIFGPITLNAVNKANSASLYNAYKSARENFYKQLADRRPALKVFLKGWLNRIQSFTDFKTVATGGAAALLIAIGIYFFSNLNNEQ